MRLDLGAVHYRMLSTLYAWHKVYRYHMFPDPQSRIIHPTVE